MSYTNGLDKPTDYFNTLTYTGDGTDNRSITGLGFQPDFCWFKDRTGANSHNLFDSVRGVQKPLRSDSSGAELSGFDLFDSFDSDGFTVSGSTADNTNYNGSQFASWNWLGANGTASNTDGSITSSVSANTTAGFSIVSFTGNSTAGATVGHSLGTVPSMIILKSRNSTDLWFVQHTSLGATKFLRLNDTNASTTQTNVWNDTEPTSSVFSLGDGSGTNGSSNNFIAYCFAEKKGYSKFGSYTGNGNANGTFVYTGMKSSFIMLKESSGTSDWSMYDNKREPFNVADSTLEANTSDAEAVVSGRPIDILSNGFKLRGDSSYTNESGQTYIYMAFAENPFVTSTGIPCTAR